MIIAEQVVAALDGGLVTNAVNIPVVDKASLDVLGPFVPLAAQLGRLAVELAGGRPRRVVVAAHGPISDFDTRLLTVAALDGIFRGRVDQTVNYVNASLLAAERGITVSEERLRASRDYMNILEVRVTAEGGDEVEVSGTTIGPEPRLFLASAYGFGIDIELAPDMVFFRYDDIPGVIGKVGTLFGNERRQHREHGRLADARRPAGADGALGRRAALGRAHRGDAQRGLRRCDLHRARLSRQPAGRGSRWVVTQFALMAAIIVAGFLPPAWPDGAQDPLRAIGAVLAVAGLAFAVWAARSLGSALTPFPKPLGTGLVTRGPFAIVRHPIYTGGLAFFAGYALFTKRARARPHRRPRAPLGREDPRRGAAARERLRRVRRLLPARAVAPDPVHLLT